MIAREREFAVRRLVAKYGRGRVALMAELFTHGETCAYVATIFGVSRQAAGLWRRLLGADVHTFAPHPDVVAIANEPALRRVS